MIIVDTVLKPHSTKQKFFEAIKIMYRTQLLFWSLQPIVVKCYTVNAKAFHGDKHENSENVRAFLP